MAASQREFSFKEQRMSNLYDIAVNTIDGSGTTLGAHAGKVLLVVNVASQCGLTPQYEGLEALHEKYEAQDFSVLGFPANDFGGQEPGTDEEIKEFCSSNYAVKFPLFSKIPVTGEDKHALYAHLTTAEPRTEDREGMEGMLRGHNMEPTAPPEVLWNFEKFLIDKQGNVVRRFAPDTAPDATKLIDAVEAELAKS
jgi:glutathione peroxidase